MSDYGSGGGIQTRNGTLTLTGCIVSGNQAVAGAGIASRYTELTLTGCTISDNTTASVSGQAYYGGGLLLDVSFPFNVVDCTFEGNTASDGGAIYAVDYAGQIDPIGTIKNSTLSGNTATQAGGGISFSGIHHLDALIDSCTISGNTAPVGAAFRTAIISPLPRH